MRTHLTVGAIAALLLASPAVPAHAKPIEQAQFDDHFVEDIEGFCGDLQVRLDVRDRGHYSLRLGGPGRLPRYTANHHGGASWTNVATGRAFTAEWDYSVHDVHVTDNGDGTLGIEYQVPGPERIDGPDGQRLHLSTGMVRYVAIVDHGGTPQDPSDDVFLYEEVVSDHGFPPQPDVSFCDSFHELTG